MVIWEMRAEIFSDAFGFHLANGPRRGALFVSADHAPIRRAFFAVLNSASTRCSASAQ